MLQDGLMLLLVDVDTDTLLDTEREMLFDDEPVLDSDDDKDEDADRTIEGVRVVESGYENDLDGDLE